jgi:hypothetical protein
MTMTMTMTVSLFGRASQTGSLSLSPLDGAGLQISRGAQKSVRAVRRGECVLVGACGLPRHPAEEPCVVPRAMFNKLLLPKGGNPVRRK